MSGRLPQWQASMIESNDDLHAPCIDHAIGSIVIRRAITGAAAMRFDILGPMQVRDGARLVRVGGPRERKILATLLTAAGRQVSAERLAAAVWGFDTPTTAQAQLHNGIAALRRVLRSSAADSVEIDRVGSGFRIRLGGGQLDVAQFDDLVARARRAAEPHLAADLHRAALALWRGRALDGLGDGPVLGAAAQSLEERRLACLEERIALDLQLGRHHELVPELLTLIQECPDRELMVEMSMLALYRSGRREEALAVYTRSRRSAADRAGLDPSPRLTSLHLAILRGDADLDASGPERVDARARGTVRPPAQLPAPPAAFVGRSAQLAAFDEAVAGVPGGAFRRAQTLLLTGPEGVGKSALAVHWAWRARRCFPDGQLYIDLHGHTAPGRVSTIDALSRLLRALGLGSHGIPADVEEAASLYRTLLADRRVLVLIDDACGAASVRPLLPGGCESIAVVTSRHRLDSLVIREGARRIAVGPLTDDEAMALLESLLGAPAVAAEPVAAGHIVEACGRLPLAIRAAAAHAGLHPDGRIRDHLDRLPPLCREPAGAARSDPAQSRDRSVGWDEFADDRCPTPAAGATEHSGDVALPAG